MIFSRALAGVAFAALVVASSTAAAAGRPIPAEVVQRAEALTQQQIEATHNVRALQNLGGLYQAAGDKQRYRWTMKQLTTLVPGSLKLKLDLAASYAADDMKTPAYDTLLRLKGQGFGVDLSTDQRFDKIHGTQVWDYIVGNLKESLKPFGEGKPAFTLDKKDLLIQAIGWDPARKQFLLGSAREGKIFLADKHGKLHDFIAPNAKNKLWAIMDLRVDAKRNRLWVATTSIQHFRGYSTDNAGKAALAEFNLKTGKLLHRYEMPGTEVFLSTLALAPNGDIFAADGVNRVIYTINKGKLTELVANKHLTAIRAMAVSEDGKILYLADPRAGIIGFELSTGKAFGLAYNPETLVLPGIVGMYTYDGTLVVIEPGMTPERVMRLSLSKDGRSVTKAMPLDVAKPDFKALGAGTVAGDTLYFIVNNQQAHYDVHGLPNKAELQPLMVYASNLRFSWGESGINTGMQELAKPAAKASRPATNKSMFKPAPSAAWLKSGTPAPASSAP
ncbi:MAG: hypothetical protein L0H70_07520 [Xanthomonadales bacterium]|nr:hypothetical protein [Xanthomonadales bacterium]